VSIAAPALAGESEVKGDSAAERFNGTWGPNAPNGAATMLKDQSATPVDGVIEVFVFGQVTEETVSTSLFHRSC